MKTKKIFLYLSVLILLITSFLCLKDQLVPHDHSTNEDASINYFKNLAIVDFKKKLANKEEFIIYFGYDDCPGCKEFTPKIINLSKEYEFPKIFHVDPYSDDGTILIDEYGVEIVPTILIFENGEVQKRITYSGETEKQLENIIYGG